MLDGVLDTETEIERIRKDEIGVLGDLAVEVAKDINRVRPDLILVPLIGGYPVYKFAFEALRRKLKVTAKSYDPTVVCISLHGASMHYDEAKLHLKKIKNKFGGFKRTMILDEVGTGAGIYQIFHVFEKDFSELSKKVYASCFADYRYANDRQYITNWWPNVYMHSDPRLPRYPLRDNHRLIGVHYSPRLSYVCHDASVYFPENHLDETSGELIYQSTFRLLLKDITDYLDRPERKVRIASRISRLKEILQS